LSAQVRVQVLMPREEAERFDEYCREKGFKKSPLIVRLVRDHLNRESYRTQRDLFNGDAERGRDER